MLIQAHVLYALQYEVVMTVVHLLLVMSANLVIIRITVQVMAFVMPVLMVVRLALIFPFV
jgi:hypothetical protein